MIKVAIVDDKVLAREWLEGKASADDAMTVAGSAASVADLMASLAEPPDVVVLDVYLHDGTRLADNVTALVAWGAQVVVISGDERSHAMRRVALQHGALSFVGKGGGFAKTRAAIAAAAAGEPLADEETMRFILMDQVPLTRTQRTVAAHIAAGLSNIEIAAQMVISKETVKEHVQAIKRAYLAAGRRAQTRAELAGSIQDDGYQNEW
jgi:DNA-binding NarL/FixJ family response regulator